MRIYNHLKRKNIPEKKRERKTETQRDRGEKKKN